MKFLNPNNVPKTLHHLISLAEKWGIRDDGYRQEMVNNAPILDLKELIDAVSQIDEDVFDDWLAGYSMEYTDEYFAFSYLRLAYDSASFKYEQKLKNET